MKINQRIWRHGVVPLAILTGYFLAASWFLPSFLPEYTPNVNSVFVTRAGRYFLILTVALLFFSLIIGVRWRRKKTLDYRVREQLTAGDLILILLPLAPIVRYVAKNQDILTAMGSAYVLAVFALFSLLFVIVLPAALGRFCSSRTLALLGAAFAFMITNMPALSARYSWLEEGNLKLQLAIFGLVFAAGWLLYRRPAGTKIARVFVAGFFVINAITSLSPADWGKKAERMAPGNKLVELVGSRIPPRTPNIYLLLYDAYVINETMLGYGIDNRAQEEFLEGRGFKIYPRTYTLGNNTVNTMSRVFNVESEPGSAARAAPAGAGVVQNLLRGFGYETYGLFQNSYLFWGIGSSYDYFCPEPRTTRGLLMKSILMGEFRLDVQLADLPRKDFLDYSLDVFTRSGPRPRFIYMHVPYPQHAQFSGNCRPDELELFQDRLAEANFQMKRDVEILLETDPGAIIIVAGDHGPYQTKNCWVTNVRYDISEISRLDIQDRFGSFLAIRWPDDNWSGYDEIRILQDLFPAVFAYLFRDRRFLEARIQTRTRYRSTISGAYVEDGIIHGGIHDGEPLFIDRREPS